MGYDMNGWIEININGYWKRCVDISVLSGRNYEFFAAFFDIINGHDEYIPLFGNRGLPEGVDYEIRKEHEYDLETLDVFGVSYFTIDELEKIDWDKQMQFVDHYGETITYTYGSVLQEEEKNIFAIMRFLKTMFDDTRCIVWFNN
jgi:hypothetical protein